MEHLQLEKPRLSASGSPSPIGGGGCMLSLVGIVVALSTMIFASCEGSRTDRMIKATERAVDDNNNGDSSSLIILIVGFIVLGVIWLIANKDKFKFK